MSLAPGLLRQLDDLMREKGGANRSQFMAEMIRDQLVGHRQWQEDREIAGTITLVYDHHKAHLQESLTSIQHDWHHLIITSVHVHLDHHNCLEVLVVRGKAAQIRQMADRLTRIKGIKHGKLTVTTTGKEF